MTQTRGPYRSSSQRGLHVEDARNVSVRDGAGAVTQATFHGRGMEMDGISGPLAP